MGLKIEWNVPNKYGTLQTKKNEFTALTVPSFLEVESVIQNPDLSDKQRLFCLYYVRCFNATKAYQKAYGCAYTTALGTGYKLLENTEIKTEIQRLKQSRLNREFLDEHDIFQKYMDIAFADITDYVEFGREKVQVMGAFGPVEVKNPETGKKEPLIKEVNTVRFRESGEVDGTLISEVKQGKDGASIKLLDRMKALDWLAEHMNIATEEQRLRIATAKAKMGDTEEVAEDDGFLDALNGSATDDWADDDSLEVDTEDEEETSDI
ncbi:MAG: terminase small subunit [Lachnospiraceae bacterium]